MSAGGTCVFPNERVPSSAVGRLISASGRPKQRNSDRFLSKLTRRRPFLFFLGSLRSTRLLRHYRLFRSLPRATGTAQTSPPITIDLYQDLKPQISEEIFVRPFLMDASFLILSGTLVLNYGGTLLKAAFINRNVFFRFRSLLRAKS